jgi:signal transduction histidine kinase
MVSHVPAWLRGRRWALLLIPVAWLYAMIAARQPQAGQIELIVAVVLVVFAPRLAAQAVPFAVLGLGCWGLLLFNRYRRGFPVMTRYGFVPAGYQGSAWFLVVQALAVLVAGLWLLVRVRAPGSRPVAALARRLWHPRGGVPQWAGLLLIPVLVIAAQLLGLHNWFGFRAMPSAFAVAVDVIAAGAALVLILRSLVWTATVAAAGLVVLGAYGILVALLGPGLPGHMYGFAALPDLNDPLSSTRALAGVQGAVLLVMGLWLVPYVKKEHVNGSDQGLAERARQLTERVETLTQTRSDAVDAAAAELRRIERDLHDGAQARLVALGMSLRAAEQLIATSPQSALALVSEARETSSRALAELRDLVRGIYPPVLADRGLGDAVRALALDTPLHTTVHVDLHGDIEMPVGSAVYFGVAEALANAIKHSGARTVRVQLSHDDAVLRAQVTDDGVGGADPANGTGLKGVERRLAAFDGILAVSSPPGGPTILAIEVPCALSSQRRGSAAE